MNPKTEQLLATLEVITEGLWFATQSGYQIYPFVWKVEEKGEFNLINFLIDQNHLQIVDSKHFSKAWRCATKELKQPSSISEGDRQPIAFIEELQSNLTDLEFYSLGRGRDSLFSQMIVGKTADDAWFGFTNARDERFLFTRKTVIVKDGYTTQQAEILKARIDPFIEEMKLLLKKGSYIDPEIVWEVAESKSQVLIKLLNSSRFVESDRYFSLQDERLNDFITSQLEQLGSYVVDWNIYAIGQIPNGDWLGVATSGYWD
ncbi:nuclease A inhibitor family protein [Aerosakkonema funiforme]|uniref:nuclease A inhibitor family protein n=1 Tax=Aerosakkonema funiforme TaxID=1246630 RepID=UPI0035B9CF21